MLGGALLRGLGLYEFGKMLGGAFTVLGHMFPVFFHFRGGKGILCCAAIAGAMDWWAFAVILGTFILVLVLTKYVSLGSCMTVNVVSFGFKYGLPLDADLVFDVRFLPNPFYIAELKQKTGLDEPVRNFVFQYQQTKDYMEKLEDLIAFTLPKYVDEGKSDLVIAIGCTGGRHRSVAMPRNTSTHAAGVVITRLPVYDYVPLSTNDDTIVTQYTMTSNVSAVHTSGQTGVQRLP